MTTRTRLIWAALAAAAMTAAVTATPAIVAGLSFNGID
jgi:hypothetical protein